MAVYSLSAKAASDLDAMCNRRRGDHGEKHACTIQDPTPIQWPISGFLGRSDSSKNGRPKWTTRLPCVHGRASRALQSVAAGMEVDVAQLQSVDRSWAVSKQRTLAAYLLIRRGDYRARDVAAVLDRDPATVSAVLTRFAARLRQEPGTQRELNRLSKIIKIQKHDPDNESRGKTTYPFG